MRPRGRTGPTEIRKCRTLIKPGARTRILPKREWESKIETYRTITNALGRKGTVSTWRWTKKNRIQANGFEDSDSIMYGNGQNEEYKQREL